MATVEVCSEAMFCRTECVNKRALRAAHTTTNTLSSTQLRGLNQTRTSTTSARPIVIRRKNEKKRPRVTSCPLRLGCHLGNLEAITGPAHGLKIARGFGVGLDLLANTADVHINRTR